MYQNIIKMTIILSLLSGCGGGTLQSTSQDEVSEVLNKNAKVYFGTLSDATINIYELGSGEKRLLFSETTTMGESIDEIGNFNAHTESLNKQIFYLYELSGGKNWDIDHNGVVDSAPTINNSTYRAIYKGSRNHVVWWGSRKSNRVVGLSEKF